MKSYFGTFNDTPVFSLGLGCTLSISSKACSFSIVSFCNNAAVGIANLGRAVLIVYLCDSLGIALISLIVI